MFKIHPIKEHYVYYGKIKKAQKALLRLCKLRVYWLIMSVAYYWLDDIVVYIFFRKWPFSGEDDRGKTSPRALVFTRCDIQSERL